MHRMQEDGFLRASSQEEATLRGLSVIYWCLVHTLILWKWDGRRLSCVLRPFQTIFLVSGNILGLQGGTVSRTEATSFTPAHMNLSLGDQTSISKELVKNAADGWLGNQTLKIERPGTHGGSRVHIVGLGVCLLCREKYNSRDHGVAFPEVPRLSAESGSVSWRV